MAKPNQMFETPKKLIARGNFKGSKPLASACCMEELMFAAMKMYARTELQHRN